MVRRPAHTHVANSTLFADTPIIDPFFGPLQTVSKNVCCRFLRLAD
jgi:hypothetical protein